MPQDLGVSLNSAATGTTEEKPRVAQRYGNKKETAVYCGFSLMTLHRLMTDPDQKFPKPSKVLSKDMLSFDEIDAWMRSKREATSD